VAEKIAEQMNLRGNGAMKIENWPQRTQSSQKGIGFVGLSVSEAIAFGAE
jgi:predicted XRE-type DNA-binding protein